MKRRLAESCGQQLALAGRDKPKLWVLDGDLADSDGSMYFAHAHPSRFLMAGIAEQNMVSVAAGMAAAGLNPWAFSFAAFLCFRAYDQIRVCISQARQPVVLVGSHAGGQSGRNGKTHCAVNDLALMLSLPGLDVWSPGDHNDVKFAVDALSSGTPRAAYLRLPRSALDPELPSDCLGGTPAPFRFLRPPCPITLVSTGIATQWARAAAEILEAEGINVGLLHCLQLNNALPFSDLLSGVSHIVTVEDHYTFGGLASLVVRHQLPACKRVDSYGWPNDWSGKSGDDDALLAEVGLSGPSLVASIRSRALRGAQSTSRMGTT